MEFKNWLLYEMPLISLRGKKAFADEEELKNTDVERVSNNIVMFRQPESNEMSFIAPGTTWLYFMDSEESAQQMKSGQIPMLMVPKGTFMSGGSPITDIWKKKFQKPGTEHILGVIEGSTNKDEIFIDMMSVRAGYRRNTINSKMVQYLKKVFPKAKISYSHPTDSGKKFISSFAESKFLIPELPKPARTAAQTLGAEPDYKPTDFKELESLEKTLQWAKDNLKEIESKLKNEEPGEEMNPTLEKPLHVSLFVSANSGAVEKDLKKIKLGLVSVNQKSQGEQRFIPIYAYDKSLIPGHFQSKAHYNDDWKAIFFDIKTLESGSATQLAQVAMHELTHAIDPKQNSKYKISPTENYRELPEGSPFKYARYVKDAREFDAAGGEVYYLIASKLKHLSNKEATDLLANIQNWLKVGGKTPELLDSFGLTKRFEIWKTRPTLWRRFKLRLYDLIQTLKGQYLKEHTETPDAEYLGELFNHAEDWSDFVHYLRVQLKDDPGMRFEIVAPWVSLEKTRSAKALIDMYRSRLNIDRFAIRATREQRDQDVNLFQSGLEWIEEA